MTKTTNDPANEQINFKELVKDINICMFTTIDDKGDITSRPMATIDIDEDGNVWFFTNEFSEKIHEVSKDNTVNLIYAHPGKNTYLNVKGTCKVVIDRAKMKELWNPMMKAWFPGGLDDAKLCLVKVMTKEAQYWNNSSNKMVVFVNMLKAIVKGEKYDEGATGKIKL